jgi:uncharacterized protein
MERKYQVFSGDGHTEVPAEMWTPRVPAKYRDLAPRLVIKEDGTTAWRMAEFERENWGNLVGELSYDETVPGCWTYTFPDGTPRPGTGDGAQRLRDQDADGIDAEVLFPPVHGPKFLRSMIDKDKDAYLSFIKAYNDWLALDYCSVAPDRLVGNALLPETCVDDAVAEMERTRAMGLRGVYLGMFPNGGLHAMPEDDRFWAASLDLDVRLAPHGVMGGPYPANELGVPEDPRYRAFTLGAEHLCVKSIVQLIVNGVLDRFPDLLFYFGETNAGWLPYTLSMMDEFYSRWYHYCDVALRQMPSEYIRQNFMFNFIDDRMAVRSRYYIGLDILVFGTDFPHSVGTYPNTREIMADLFEGVPEAERRQMTVENICRFYGMDPNQTITPTPAAVSV